VASLQKASPGNYRITGVSGGEKETENSLNVWIISLLMNYLKEGLKKTWLSIKEHKYLFFLIVFLQIVLLIALAGFSYDYQLKILENARGVIEPLEQANYNATSIEAGMPFSTNMLKVYKNYQEMKKNIFSLISWLGGLFLIVNGALWLLSHRLLGTIKTWKEAGSAYLKFLAASLVGLAPFFICSYFILSNLMRLEIPLSTLSWIFQVVIYSIMIIYFFLMASFAFIETKSWKEWLKVWFKVAFKNLHLTLIMLLINLVLILLSLYLIYFFMSENTFGLMMLFSLLLILVLVMSRIFWIAGLREIEKKD